MPFLTDSFNRPHSYLRISITDRCNLRCVYCMPPDGIEARNRDEILSFDEIVRLAEIFARMDVNKIRLTGGEPLVRKNVDALVERLSAIPGIRTLGMTTNGVLLAEQADALYRAGLRRLNISLDTLRRDRFDRIALRACYDAVMRGIDTVIERGFEPLKLNMVVMKGVNDDELCDFVEFAMSRPVSIRFIEFMPFTANRWNDQGFMSYGEMKERIGERFEMLPVPASDASDVARSFRIPGIQGTVGFISSMSEHFCATCNRVRLTADGSIKACLFAPAEVNLRSLLRDGTDDDLIALRIREALIPKQFAHVPMSELSMIENSTMISIGG